MEPGRSIAAALGTAKLRVSGVCFSVTLCIAILSTSGCAIFAPSSERLWLQSQRDNAGDLMRRYPIGFSRSQIRQRCGTPDFGVQSMNDIGEPTDNDTTGSVQQAPTDRTALWEFDAGPKAAIETDKKTEKEVDLFQRHHGVVVSSYDAYFVTVPTGGSFGWRRYLDFIYYDTNEIVLGAHRRFVD